MPLNGDLRNYGTTKLPSPSRTQVTYGNGKMGTSAACIIGWHLDEEILGNTWSVAMWVKPSSLGQYNNILFSKNISGSSDCQIYFSIVSNNALNLGINNHSSDITGTASFVNGTWYHVAATYDGTTATIYLNGQELNHKTVSSTYSSDKLNINLNGRSSNATNTTYTGWFGSSYNDFRLYDNCISAAEVREISQGLILHYKLDGTDIPNENLGNTSADYHNFSDGYSKATGSWGGDAGTVTFHHSGGYAGLPYKELHKTATGTGGIYSKTADDIILESNTTYTMSCWIKASRNFRPIHYSFNINRGVGNVYITYGSSFDLTTEWQFFSKTFTTTEDQAGSYGEMSIIYDDNETDYYVYYSGFKIEKGATATRWTPPGIQYTTIQDSSGYNNNAISNGSQPVAVDSDTPKYSASTKFISGSRIAMPVASSTCLPTQAITVSIWYKSSAGTTRFLSCTESGGWNFEVNSSKASFPFYIKGKGYGRVIATQNFYSDNIWHMITASYDGISTAKIYLDGQLNNTATITSGWENIPLAYNTSTPLTLGAEAQTIASPIAGTYVGSLSDLRIYCTALSDDAVLGLYHTGAKIDNNNNFHTFEFIEHQDNKLFLPECSRINLEFSNGLSRYTQANCQVNLTEEGYHIYRPPNLTTAANGNTMWGGLKLVNQSTDTIAAYSTPRDNVWGLQKSHTYLMTFHAKGKSSNATTFGWANNMGWSGGGVTPSPTMIVNDGIPTDFEGEKDCVYIFTINDDIAKNCTTAYSSYVAGTSYLSYRHLTFGWGYTSTGTLGTDLYITNLRLYDITSNMAKITKTGVSHFFDIVEENSIAKIRKNSELIASEFIEL